MLALLLVVAVGACSRGDAEEPSPSPTTPSPSPSPSPETATAPLTGEELEDLDVAERPVVAVKIENTAEARPQAGLDAADIVFEELTEGGVTRFLALFQSDVPELVGPIRSGRPEDAQVLPAYDPMLFISGARPDVLSGLRAAGVDFRGEDGEVLYREGSRSAPHNVFARGEAMFALADGVVPAARPTGWRFDETAPDGEVPCTTPCAEDPGHAIRVEMSAHAVAVFRYDEDAEVYRREQNGVPQTVTGVGRVGAANVLVLETQVLQSGCCDPAGNPLTVTEIVASGRALILRDGNLYEGRWAKGGPDDHIQVLGPENESFAFRPGPTWALFAPPGSLPSPTASPGADADGAG